MLGTIQFDFPIGGPNDRFARNRVRLTAICTLLTANWTDPERASVDVNHVGHNANHTADWADEGQLWLRIVTLNLTCPVCAASSTGRRNTCLEFTRWSLKS